MPSTHPVSRRRFLAGAAALSGATALSAPAAAQSTGGGSDASPSLTWTRTHLPPDAEQALIRDVVPVGDGVGLVGLAGGYHTRCWVAETDSAGRARWHRRLGTERSAFLAGAPTAGGAGAFVAAGVANQREDTAAVSRADPYVAETRAGGEVTWARTYQPSSPDGGASALVRADEGHVVAGSTTVDGRERPWAAGLDAYGTRTWTWRSGDDRAGDANGAAAVGDGVVLGGSRWPPGADVPAPRARQEAAWVAKLTPGGETAWRWGVNRERGDRVEAVAPGPDGGAVAVGRRGFATDDRGVGWLVALDAAGDRRWERTYPREGWNWIHDLAPVGRGYALVGTREPGPDTEDRGAWVLRVDAAGRPLWEAIYGLDVSPNTGGFAVHPAGDGGLLVGGDQYVAAQDRDEAWLAKVGGDPASRTRSDGSVELPAAPDWTAPVLVGGALGALGAKAAGHVRGN